MKKTLFFFFLFSAIFSFGQSSFPLLSLKAGSSYGYSIGKADNLKRVMLAKGLGFTIEQNCKAGVYVTFGAELLTLNFNYTKNNVSAFSHNNFLLVPVSLKKYYFIGKRSHLYWDFGVAAAWYRNRDDEFENGTDSSKNNIGYNFGAFANVGFKTSITNKLSFDVGLKNFQSVFYSYKNNNDKLTINTSNLALSFYWNMK